MRRYLLGELPEAEREALEREYFTDRRVFEQVVRAENELVDGYARGLLSQPTRERFEQDYLSRPERRERAKFAAALVAWLEGEGVTAAAVPPGRAESFFRRWLASIRRPALAWAFSAVFLLAAASVAWYLLRASSPRQELAKSEAVRDARAPRADETRRQTAGEQPSPVQPPEEAASPPVARQDAPAPTPVKAAPAFISLTLTIDATRGVGAAPQILNIPVRTGEVRLRLDLMESEYPRYDVALQTAGGAEIFTRRRLTPRSNGFGAEIVFNLPARRLAAGDYVLTLRGVGAGGEVEDVSKSLLRVERK